MKLRKIYIRSLDAFTLVEVLITIGLLVLIAGFGLFISMDAYRGDTFRAESAALVSIFQKARNQAISNIDQMPHGVRVESSPARYVIFAGAIYDQTDPRNQIIEARPTITNDGPKEFIFAQLSGDVAVPGSLTITDNVKSETIFINDEGQINW